MGGKGNWNFGFGTDGEILKIIFVFSLFFVVFSRFCTILLFFQKRSFFREFSQFCCFFFEFLHFVFFS